MESVKEIMAGMAVGVITLGLIMAFIKASDPCHEANIVEDCRASQNATECTQTRRKVCR